MWHPMWGWNDPWGVGWAVFAVMHVLWWVIVIGLAIAALRAMTGRYRRPRDSALDILRRRYARGEIDAAEFQERKKQLRA